jgi:hypothetical protein
MSTTERLEMMIEDQAVRLELLIGHLSDVLRPARALIEQLQLRANASVTTRSELEHLCDVTGSIWTTLDQIHAEIRNLRDPK